MPANQEKAFSAFYDSVRHNEVLDEKTTILIQLAAAIAVGCIPWMEHYFGVAKERNISDDEIGAAESIVMAVSAGRVRAQFREARARHKKTSEQHGTGH